MSRGDRREDIFLDDVDRQATLAGQVQDRQQQAASVDASQRGGPVDAEAGVEEELRSHEKRTKLWVAPPL